MVLPHDDVGAGAVVVLLHAGIADRTMWSEHLEPLASAGYRVVALDLPGFGEAPVQPGEQAPWSDVLATLRELGIERAALVGNSFGGAVVLRVAALAAGLAWALVLVAAPMPGFEPSARLLAAWEAEEEALERDDLQAAVDAIVAAWVLPEASDELRDRVAGMQRRAFELQRDAQAVTEAPDPLEGANEPIDEILARLDVPSLVVAGGRDMADFADGASRLAGALPQADQVTIASAGHLVPLDEPGEFRRVLLEFLARHRP